MNDQTRNAQLLDRGDVAMATVARKNIFMDAPVAYLLRNDSAFRTHREAWTSPVSLSGVSPTKRPTLEQGRLRNRLCGAVRGDALQNSFRQAMGDQGAGARGQVFSQKQESNLWHQY